jgi:hypothetical protein
MSIAYAPISSAPVLSAPDASADDLTDLLAFIRGEGKWSFFGRGITTYPSETDDRHQRLHAACLRLEAEGKIRRKLEDERHVMWVGADQ